MVNGILLLESGEVQMIGEIRSARNIIAAIQHILPQLIEQEKKVILDGLSARELEEILEQKRTGATERLEP